MRYLSVAEFAKLKRVKPATVRLWCRAWDETQRQNPEAPVLCERVGDLGHWRILVSEAEYAAAEVQEVDS